MNITILTLNGKSKTINVCNEFTVLELYMKVHQLFNESISNFRLLCQRQLLYEKGLDYKLSNFGKDELKINLILNLVGGMPYPLFKVRNSIYKTIDDASKDYPDHSDYNSVLSELIYKKIRLDNLYQLAMSSDTVNDTDFITGDPLSEGISVLYWREGDKNYGMTFNSMMKYIHEYKYKDLNGKIQIKNPYTTLDIQYPFRKEFLERYKLSKSFIDTM